VAALHEMVMTMFRPAGAPLQLRCPATTAFQQLWQVTTETMSSAWCDRFAADYARFLCATIREIQTRHQVLDRDSYLALRRETGGVLHLTDQIEWVGRFELPPQVATQPTITELRSVVADVVAWINDVQSVERELARGDRTHNLVLVVEADRGCGREQAIAEVVAMTTLALRRVDELVDAVSALCGQLGLAGEYRRRVERYVVGCQDVIAGYYDWSGRSSRYGPPAGAAPVVDDLLTSGA